MNVKLYMKPTNDEIEMRKQEKNETWNFGSQNSSPDSWIKQAVWIFKLFSFL